MRLQAGPDDYVTRAVTGAAVFDASYRTRFAAAKNEQQ
ncbi:Hypothetical protein CpCap5W_1700 [Corynebacterium pseudotuberculosis]|nr:Hypothetical protein Cp3995_1013 [Corynebacterium pseudotuberculosis 3/99-5]AFH51937.1 Hypothetical protein Cp267_1038 [Corynebacterium pseudotuberculosis 267]AIG07391.1 hypothetical protein CPTA_01562 [Corynebacterium pseudotuberculosis]AIG10258.1 hypothetical protein CPTB_02202 [Corynebacterium pseudotuberculosis]AIG11840.1 hypothetical protein CPTC_01552 [Corynebacterium pseudotuberculosis]